MTRKQNPLDKLLGPLEQEVMDVMWSLGDATVRDVHDVLADRRKIAYTTVMTTMTRLASKGFLRQDKSAVAHKYRPATSRETYASTAVARLFEFMVERYPEPAVSYLAEIVEGADDVSIDELRAAVNRRRDRES